MKKLIVVAVVLVAVFFAKDKVQQMASGDPEAAGKCGTPESYAANCLKNDLAIDFGEGDTVEEAGRLFLRGSLTNLGSRRLSEVTMRIGATGDGRDSSFTHRLGAFEPEQTRKFDDLLDTVWGQESADGTSVEFEYQYRLAVVSVRFAD
jgi:hypothetical protein